MAELIYDPSVFVCSSVQEARNIILTPEAGLTPDERWERETAWLLPKLDFSGCRLVLDYGCGIGRLAGRIEQAVVGVDISLTMLKDAIDEVRRAEFAPLTPDMLSVLVAQGLRADGAMAVWSLQHVYNISDTLALIASALVPGSPFYVVNRDHRCVPVSDGERQSWADDGIDVRRLIFEAGFSEKALPEPMPETLCQPGAALTRWRRC